MPTPSFTDFIRAYLEAQFGGDVPPIPGITIDSELSDTSENPVQNKVITAALALKAALTDIPAMATNANMTDWTSGKTVDAAVLKTTVIAAERRISALDDSVSELGRDKADASDVPTAVSDLTNDSGFVNAAGAAAAAPVSSVNGQTGAVTLTIPSTAADVGAVASNQGSANAGKFLSVDSSGNVIVSALPLYNGGVS